MEELHSLVVSCDVCDEAFELLTSDIEVSTDYVFPNGVAATFCDICLQVEDAEELWEALSNNFPAPEPSLAQVDAWLRDERVWDIALGNLKRTGLVT